MEDFSKYNGPGTKLRERQMRILAIMRLCTNIAREHGIPIWMDFGTLLGAVRHRGFIPWDDDADLTILRQHSSTLAHILARELPQGYSVTKADARFRYRGYFKVTGPSGEFLDIFNVEPGSRKLKTRLNRSLGKASRRLSGQIRDGVLRKALSYAILPFAYTQIGLYRLFHKKSHTLSYNLENYVVPQMLSERTIEQIFPLQSLEFEGVLLPAPANTHAFLTETYKDYMRIPEPSQRQTHS